MEVLEDLKKSAFKNAKKNLKNYFNCIASSQMLIVIFFNGLLKKTNAVLYFW